MLTVIQIPPPLHFERRYEVTSKGMSKLAFVSLIFSLAATLHAGTVTVGPSDCSAAAVNAAISASTTHNGDTVLLTCTGSINWASTGTHSWAGADNGTSNYAVNIPATKGITLQVQGASNTNKSSPTFPLTITLPNNVQAIVANIGANNSPTRISGFKFQQSSGSVDGFISVVGAGTGNNGLGGYRVDNNYFNGISVWDGVIGIWSGRNGTTGNLFGLVDNNTFYNIFNSTNPAYGPYVIQIWNWWHPGTGNYCFGCDGWTNNDFVYGGGNENFIEDNLFDQEASASGHVRHYISSELGARYVSRHNTFTNNYSDQNVDLHDAHGLCGVGSNGAGARGGEIYANTIQGTGYDRAVGPRGGSWLIYDNTITPGGGNPIELMEYRSEASSAYECDATNALGLMPPWPVPAGASWGANDPWRSDVSGDTANPGTYHPLPQQIFNSYMWNNKTPGGTLINPVVPIDGSQIHYIISGTDYFASASKPATLSYTAYTYPHPLRTTDGSAPHPPTGLTATVQ